MTTTASTNRSARLCSVFSATNDEDPGGTAPSWKRCVVIELKEPWEKEIATTSHFPQTVSDVLERAEQRGMPVRLQCMTPDAEHSVDGHSRVIYYSLPEGAAVYDKEEFVLPVGEVGALVEALVESRGALDRFESYRQDTARFRDILVCTQGTYDVCCASFGYRIYQALRDEYVPRLGDSLRVWRVSHLGGHRFAPNLIDMPEGRNWVRMGPDDLGSIVLRDHPVSELRRFYRGWLGLDSPLEQLVEREAFMSEGWGWTDRAISGRLVSANGADGPTQVRIGFGGLNGSSSGAYQATVERSGSVQSIECVGGAPATEYPQYTVSRLVRES